MRLAPQIAPCREVEDPPRRGQEKNGQDHEAEDATKGKE
jgi:hypothetical protein